MLGLRVAALLLLCSTPVSATEEDLSTGLKAKLEEMGVDSMPKRVHTWTTLPRQTTAQHPTAPTSHCRRVWVAWPRSDPETGGGPVPSHPARRKAGGW